MQCVHNALCGPSDSAVALQKTANISTASWQSAPGGKADTLLILPNVGRLSIICVHRRNITLAEMKTWTFRWSLDRRSEANPCAFMAQAWSYQSNQLGHL